MQTSQIEEKWKRISGLIRGADSFLFGLLPGNQNMSYRYLKQKNGFCDEYERQYRGAYNYVLNEILKNQGVERLVNEVIIPLAKEEFGYELQDGISVFEVLEEYWNKGTPPDKDKILKFRTGNIKGAYEDWKNLQGTDTDLRYETHFESHKEYKDEKNKTYGKGCCKLLDITEVGGRWIIRFSDFCKLWYAELAEIAKEPERFSRKTGSFNSQLSVDTAKISTPDIDVTNRFFKVLEAVPCGLSNDSYNKMLTKILAITSISKLPETRPIYEQLSKIIDFGHIMSLIE
jgi:hypothetical protein